MLERYEYNSQPEGLNENVTIRADGMWFTDSLESFVLGYEISTLSTIFIFKFQ